MIGFMPAVRRTGPLHRWSINGPAPAALPARSPARCEWCLWSPAVRVPGRPSKMDVPGVRSDGVRATATCRLRVLAGPAAVSLGGQFALDNV